MTFNCRLLSSISSLLPVTCHILPLGFFSISSLSPAVLSTVICHILSLGCRRTTFGYRLFSAISSLYPAVLAPVTGHIFLTQMLVNDFCLPLAILHLQLVACYPVICYLSYSFSWVLSNDFLLPLALHLQLVGCFPVSFFL